MSGVFKSALHAIEAERQRQRKTEKKEREKQTPHPPSRRMHHSTLQAAPALPITEKTKRGQKKQKTKITKKKNLRENGGGGRGHSV